MKRIRTHLRLAAGALVLLIGVPAFAQGPQGGLDLRYGNAFAPADLSEYANRPEPKQGYFFSAHWLNWCFSEPKTVPIGSPNGRFVTTNVRQLAIFGPPYNPLLPDDFFRELEGYTQQSELNTGFINSEFKSGMRYEFGRIAGHHGWMVNTYFVQPDDQKVRFTSVPVTFYDPNNLLTGVVGTFIRPISDTQLAPVAEVGAIPVIYGAMEIQNRFSVWSVDANYVYRMHRNHYRAPHYIKPARALEKVFDGSLFEWYLGARYTEMDGNFNVYGIGGTLSDSYWNTEAENHIVGPLAGVRWVHTHQRFSLAVDGRFIAGYNRQNFYQEGILGSAVTVGGIGNPTAWPGNPFTHKVHNDEFSPIAELRVEVKYQLTRALSFSVGWNGTWADHIARASSVIDYRVPSLGIDLGRADDENLFMHGLVIGAEINR